MKKQYVAPLTEVTRIQQETLICSSPLSSISIVGDANDNEEFANERKGGLFDLDDTFEDFSF